MGTKPQEITLELQGIGFFFLITMSRRPANEANVEGVTEPRADQNREMPETE